MLEFFEENGFAEKYLKPPIDQTVWVANQSIFRKYGRLKAKRKLENNKVEEEIISGQEPPEPSMVIGWNTSRLLRIEAKYPKCLKVNYYYFISFTQLVVMNINISHVNARYYVNMDQ